MIPRDEMTAAESVMERLFGQLMEKLDGRNLPIIGQVAARLIRRMGEGHVFLDPRAESFPSGESPGEIEKLLESSPVVGSPGVVRPLILSPSGKLYAQRYWEYERNLAGELKKRSHPPETWEEDLENRLNLLFEGAEEQKEAARTAIRHRFCIIAGGPGTGKTTTVLKIVGLLRERFAPAVPRVFLAAPTGKAATRLQAGLEKNGCPTEGVTTSTIHRILGVRPDSVFFRHHAGNPLPADIFVVDEASMIDLPLMAKLLDALPAECGIIVLGDQHQLVSVETGYVLGGMIEAAEAGVEPLAGKVASLTRNHRFGETDDLFRICGAVRRGRVDEVLSTAEGTPGGFTWRHLPSASDLKETLRPIVLAEYGPALTHPTPEAVFAALSGFQMLTPLRHGWHGRDGLNQLTGEILREEGLTESSRAAETIRPLLVTENDYQLGLYNGDTGILFPGPEGDPMAWFPDGRGGMRMISPWRLPAVETAYALTIHKSQGSEYDRVLLLLPPTAGQLLSRELVYTGLSRARKNATLWADPETLRLALGKRTKRASGLREMLSLPQPGEAGTKGLF